MILQDKLIIQKTSHSAHILSVYKCSKMVFRKQLSTKDFLKHDLLHTALHFLTSGDIFQPEDETMQMEFIAGTLHKIYDPEFDVHDSYQQSINYMKEVEKIPPAFFTLDFLKEVRTFVMRYFTQFKTLKTGKSMEIVFKKY